MLRRTSTLTVAVFVMAICTLSAQSSLFAESSVLQVSPLQFRLEGLTRSPSTEMTSGSLGGWNEDEWVPFQLVVTNKGESDHVTDLAIDLEYENAGRYGIDAFGACFSESAADCGSGMTPAVGASALGSGSLWKLLVDSSEQVPEVSFQSMMGGVTVIRWHLRSVSVPANSSFLVRWAVHLAEGNSTNLACAEASPLATCSPQTVPVGMGEASWPGRSLQVRTSLPIPGERTVSIDVAQPATQQQPPTSGCLVATAAYGSELEPEVIRMRSVRDNLIGSTPTGRTLVAAFNAFYYLWSPAAAEWISTSELLRTVFRIMLLPLVGIVQVAALTFAGIVSAVGRTDAASVATFFVAATLTLATYIVLPMIAMAKLLAAIRKRLVYLKCARAAHRFRNTRKNTRPCVG